MCESRNYKKPPVARVSTPVDEEHDHSHSHEIDIRPIIEDFDSETKLQIATDILVAHALEKKKDFTLVVRSQIHAKHEAMFDISVRLKEVK